MKYTIERLHRTVELNDELVEKYCQYDELHDQSFSIVVRTKFGHIPTEEEVSNEELSKICNDILLEELKALSLLPQAVLFADEHKDLIQNCADNMRTFEQNIGRDLNG